MNAFLPSWHNLTGLGGLFAVLILFTGLGALVTPRRTLPEIQMLAGWGVVCVVLTVWGVATPASMRIPAGVLAAAGAVCLVMPAGRARIGAFDGTWRIWVLSVPLWIMALPLRPSQFDTWVNLLPNAAYLYHHDMLPTATRPESWSFLPVAPYNSQFAAYLASLASGSFAEGAMSWFNIGLLLASTMLLARRIAPSRPVGWAAGGIAALLAMPLNPGFIPRAFLAAYGEPSLAVTTMFAVWLAAETLDDLASGRRWPGALAPLALALVAMVNIKQSGIGLVLPVGAMIGVVALLHPGIRLGRALPAILAAVVPALVLYALWRWFAVTSFAAGELKPLPMSEWNWLLLPQILAAMGKQVFQKIVFFTCLAVVIGFAIAGLRRRDASRDAILLTVIAGSAILFNGFLVFTYIAHFKAEWAKDAHSYFRYCTQLALALMLGLVVALRPIAMPWVHRLMSRRAWLAALPIALALIAPIAGVSEVRFDLMPPQPLLWDLGHAVAERLAPDTKLALLVPGDVDDADGAMLRGVIMYTPPARPAIIVRTETVANIATLDAAARDGFTTALVSGTPAGLPGVPAGVAALLRHGADGWRLEQAWPYPPGLRQQRFAGLLAAGPLCAE